MASPEGLHIGKATKPWKIGKKLGSGACGAVHELLPPPGTKSPCPAYAIKLVPLPKAKAASSKGKKRKKTAEERNADLILHEYNTLQNVGNYVRGKMVPEIPFMGDPPAYGNTMDNKFRFLVMERMAAPLSGVIPILLDSHGKAKGVAKIPLGDVAVAMLNCIRAIHERGNVFVDVKPENFMLSSASSASCKRSKKTSNDVSQRVRLIDFGLVEMYKDMSASKHRENAHPDAPLVGTPTYASLKIMSGHTASRRDDLEALGYVISELILMLVSTGSNAGKSKTKDGHVLPWSSAVSDSELHRIKSQEMDRKKMSKSNLFAGLKAAGADTVMGNYFSEVMSLKYSEIPDYDSLRCYLDKLIVMVERSGGSRRVEKASVSPKKPPARRTTSRQNLDNEDSDDSIEVVDENVENRKKTSSKKQKVSVGKDSCAHRTRRGRNASRTREMATQTDEVEVINIDSSSDEENTDMDWERLQSDDNESAGNKGGEGVLKLTIIEGPHQGEELVFGGDHPSTILVGRDPESRVMKDAIKLALSKDGTAAVVHAKFVINSKSAVHSVRVSDMSSSNSTIVNGNSLPKGKSKQAFVGDKITIGKSVLQIRKA